MTMTSAAERLIESGLAERAKKKGDKAPSFILPNIKGEELHPIYKNFGIDLAEYNGNDSFTLPITAAYIVDTDGVIVYSFVDADYTKRVEPDEIVSILEGLTD